MPLRTLGAQVVLLQVSAMNHRTFSFHTGALAACTALVVLSACAPNAANVRRDNPWLRDETGAPQAPGATASYAPFFDDHLLTDSAHDVATRARIATVAGDAVGGGALTVAGERFRMDCSGVARGIYAKAGVRLGTVDAATLDGAHNDTHVLFELARVQGSLRRRDPLPGDLAFFDDTYDQNRNGLQDDALSHVAVVERVLDDGTVLLVHRIGNGVVRARMNLEHPHDRTDAQGQPLNHYLRAARGSTPARTTAELFVAYGSFAVSAPSKVAARQ